MKKNISFWKIIQDNKIEVPIIQRDYAQGREESRIKDIREGFVKELVACLIQDGKKISLGFLYGRIEGKDQGRIRIQNKEAIENVMNAVKGYASQLDIEVTMKVESLSDTDDSQLALRPKFIPLDGQQRLTTVFLLHWYLNLYNEQIERDHNLKILNGFIYNTRQSSLAFCEEINTAKNLLFLPELEENNISGLIKNQNWYLKTWDRDPTVKGMLVMLDEIQKQLKNQNKSILFNRLEKDACIQFDFLDLDEVRQTDKLYVKMNARGKQLTEFEHFKAWIQKNNKKTTFVDKNWKQKLDKDWLDLIWKKNKDTYEIDDIFYHFFKQLGLYQFLLSKRWTKDFSTKISNNKNLFIPFSEFSESSYFQPQTLDFVFITLDSLSDYEKIKRYKELLQETVGDRFPEFHNVLDFYIEKKGVRYPNQPQAVFYYAIIQFINDDKLDYQSNDIEKPFKEWVRICRNLISNTYIQNQDDFKSAILSINELLDYKTDIYNHLLQRVDSIPYFNQFAKHEIEKIKLINISQPWGNAIYKYENHTYFKGDIRFIIELANTNLGLFIAYGEKASILFNDDILNSEEYLLQRALLTFGNYLPIQKGHWTFCLPDNSTLRKRRDNWQKVLNNDTKRNILKKLLDTIVIQNVSDKLIKIIERYSEENWRKYIIDCTELIKYSNLGIGLMSYYDDNTCYLLRTQKISGRHVELRSYHFYCMQIWKHEENYKPFSYIYYWEDRNDTYPPCICMENWEYNNQKIRLEITYNKKAIEDIVSYDYQLKVLKDDKTNQLSGFDEFISNHSWNKKDNYIEIRCNNQGELTIQLNSIIEYCKSKLINK